MRSTPLLLCAMACQPAILEPSTHTDAPLDTDVPPCTPAAQVVINELSASNRSTIVDEDGDSSDWIELYNAGDVAVDMTGWTLSDKQDEPALWSLPEVQLQPGGYLLVFASGKDRRSGVSRWDSKIDLGDSWRYRELTGPAAPGWHDPSYDDTRWLTGPSGFGRSDGDDATEVTAHAVQVRSTFEVSAEELADARALLLHVDYDDSFVAWLNGEEVARAGIGEPSVPPAWDDRASPDHEAQIYQGGQPEGFEVTAFRRLLRAGTNTLAVSVHDVSSTSSDLSLIPFLTLGYASDRAARTSTILDLAARRAHSNFKLRANGEQVWLHDPAGCEVDHVDPQRTLADQSFGRSHDGADDLGYFLEPTPGSANTTESRPGFSAAPVFSPPSGFYPDGVSVSLTAAPGTRITTAQIGYEPDEIDPAYTQPFALDGAAEAVVLRARGFHDGLWPSPVVTATYLGRAAGPIAVASLVTHPHNLWDQDTGMYVMGRTAAADVPHFGANFWEDWEKPLHVTLWEPDGAHGFDIDGGVEIHGGWSRAHQQKSLRVEASSGYGASEIEYQVFDDIDVDRFSALILRNSGNDWHGCDPDGCHTGVQLRDAFMHRLASSADVDVMASRPVEVYLNGEYWGLYNLRERPDADYLAAHHGTDDVDLLERDGAPVEGDASHYHALESYLRTADRSDPAVYDEVSRRVDVRSFADYFILQIWLDNTDWPGNNIKFWRPRTTDGRWRWLLYDTDFGLGLWRGWPGDNTLAFALDSNGPNWPNPPWSTEMLRLMVSMPAFQETFINRYADLMNTHLHAQQTRQTLRTMAAEIAPVIPRHTARWGEWSDGRTTHRMAAGTWDRELAAMHNWLAERNDHARSHIVSEFDLDGMWTLTLDAEPPGSGSFELAAVQVDAPFTGTYFRGVPVRITALPAEGYTFERWSDSDLPNEPTVRVDPDGSLRLTGHFR